jgi:D-amino-acid dehydrogenase
MSTVIIGGGLLGLCTAQALLERGEESIILEGREGVGCETSFANGGMLTPSMPEPWNGPGVFGHLLASLFSPGASMKLRPAAIPSLFSWGMKFLWHSSARRHLAATADNYGLSSYSLEKTREISEKLGLQYDFSDRGTLAIFSDSGQMEARHRICRHLSGLGLTVAELGVSEVLEKEPTLSPIRDRLSGGIWLPDDARGDAHMFCNALASSLSGQGIEIRTGVRASRLVSENGMICAVNTNVGRIETRRIVVAAGVHSPALLATAGESLAVKPAKGYSLTAECRGLEPLPDVTVVDDATHAVITPLGTRLRVAGTAEFAGFDTRLTQSRVDSLYRVFGAVYPTLAEKIDRREMLAWTGLRPMSSDGRPFIGSGRIKGLYVATGHGALGWTMAMGSGHLVADLITGRLPEVDAAPFAMNRR